MSRGLRSGLIVALLHVLIVAAMGAKLLVDRARLPRVWARTAPIDPDLPIRGRYVRLQLQVEPSPALARTTPNDLPTVALSVEGDRLVATPSEDSPLLAVQVARAEGPLFALERPIAYFIPEHVPDPSRRAMGEELWVEVTVPRRGPPRPIRLGVWRDGVLTPLDLQ